MVVNGVGAEGMEHLHLAVLVETEDPADPD
jgi:hypothetical protein